MHVSYVGFTFCSISEVECCSVKLARNRLAMDNLFQIALSGHSSNLFTLMLVANCIFRLTFNSVARACLTVPSVIEKILLFSEQNEHIIGFTDEAYLAIQ